MTPAYTHLRTLDGVRGLAILLVMLWHMTVIEQKSDAGQLVFALASFGWAGVDLFFVLSGLLITGILLDSREKQGYFRNFYIRRALRIWPLYYAILIFSFYILPHLPSLPIEKLGNFNRIAGSQGWYWLLLQNYSIAAAGIYRHAVMDVTWSLAIEEQFYLVWPLLVFFVASRRLLTWILVALIAAGAALRAYGALAGWNTIAIYVLTPTHLDGLCVGGLIAIAMRAQLDRRWLAWAARGALLAGGAVVLTLAVVRGPFSADDRYVEIFGFLALAVLFGGFTTSAVLTSGSGSLLDRLLSNVVLRQFGLYSYAMYLIHLPLRAFIRDRVLKPQMFNDFPGGPLVAQLVFYVVAIALTFAVAAASYHMFEKHVLKLKDVLAPSRPRPATPAAAEPAPEPAGG
jgi:peptidoglycan/LPS O-acetylase OafA/YrhL